MKNVAIIPAGGSGKRTGLDIPKQYYKVKGKEIIVYTLEAFQNSNVIDEIVIAANASYIDYLLELKNTYKLSKILNIVEGGKERQDSVFNALSSLIADKNDNIYVHDAARPLVDQRIINESFNLVNEYGSVVTAIKARDTLLKGELKVESYLSRENVFYVQTPQTFKYEILQNAFDIANNQKFIGTDESMLVKNAGYSIRILDGSILNFKITTKEDCLLLEKLV